MPTISSGSTNLHVQQYRRHKSLNSVKLWYKIRDPARDQLDVSILTCQYTYFLVDDNYTDNHRLKGPGVEIVVGIEPNVEVWSLSKTLVSQYSSIPGHAANPLDLRVTLPEEDPSIFALFVEWLFYGVYTLNRSSPPAKNPELTVDVQAWVFGDRIQCVEFKNYAMDRLYTQYNRRIFPRTITTCDVRYTFTQSARDSKLQLLYKHLLAARFFQRENVEGTASQWDSVLQEHNQLRMFIMEKAMHHGTETPVLIQHCQYYKEVKKLESKQDALLSTGNYVTPAKRNADGEIL